MLRPAQLVMRKARTSGNTCTTVRRIRSTTWSNFELRRSSRQGESSIYPTTYFFCPPFFSGGPPPSPGGGGSATRDNARLLKLARMCALHPLRNIVESELHPCSSQVLTVHGSPRLSPTPVRRTKAAVGTPSAVGAHRALPGAYFFTPD